MGYFKVNMDIRLNTVEGSWSFGPGRPVFGLLSGACSFVCLFVLSSLGTFGSTLPGYTERLHRCSGAKRSEDRSQAYLYTLPTQREEIPSAEGSSARLHSLGVGCSNVLLCSRKVCITREVR